MWNKTLVIVLCGVLMTATSCRSRKMAIMQGKPLKLLTTNRIIDSIMRHRLVPDHFATRLAVDAEWPDDSRSLKANLKMRKDSVVWTQITFAGTIVVAQAMITKDSMHLMDKMKDKYYARRIDNISEFLNTDLDLSMLQDLIWGNPLGFDPEEKYKSPSDTGYYYLTTHRKRKIKRAVEHERVPRKHPVIYQYKFYPRSFKTYEVSIQDLNDTTSLLIRYPEYQYADSVLVPAQAEIEAVKGDKKVKLSIKYTRTKVNQPNAYPFNVPDSYERL